ncbi:OV-16 antigen [Sphaceloma murrayae]|uniref:OV-16 antigen n=1 Tax=Sphaceloma murrayae TaxID=2082308 RepID=A0A2K1QG50_9PEZI|nr:OV-16 antigen [Sphaceloma murrayae]
MATLVAADLGDMIDAIIIEHRGTLNRVITNLRNRAPNMDSFKQISEDLAKVSTTMSTMRSGRADTSNDNKGRYSVILDTPPDFLKSRTRSVPDLIDYIDSAAKDLGIAIPQGVTKSAPTDLTSTSELPTPRTETSIYDQDVDQRPLDQMAVTLQNRAANKSIAPRQHLRPPPAASAYATANPSPSGSPILRAESPLILAVNVPSAMPRSVPVPMIGPDGAMIMDFTSATNPLGSIGQDPAAVAGLKAANAAMRELLAADSSSGLDGDPNTRFGLASPMQAPAPISGAEASTSKSVPTGGVAQMLVPHGTSHSSNESSLDNLPASKIPKPPSQGKATASERRHLPGSVKMVQAPWSRKGSVDDGRNPFKALKPSEVKGLGRKQGTFAQPFVRDLARDASLKERAERRARLGSR